MVAVSAIPAIVTMPIICRVDRRRNTAAWSSADAARDEVGGRKAAADARFRHQRQHETAEQKEQIDEQVEALASGETAEPGAAMIEDDPHRRDPAQPVEERQAVVQGIGRGRGLLHAVGLSAEWLNSGVPSPSQAPAAALLCASGLPRNEINRWNTRASAQEAAMASTR